MDLNTPVCARQLALMKIDTRTAGADARSCPDKIAPVATQTRRLRDRDLMTETPLPPDEELETWESEGGSLPPSADASLTGSGTT